MQRLWSLEPFYPFEDDEQRDTTYTENIDTTDMSEPETKQETAQQGQGLKIMAPKQMITRFPILLAPKKAGNNSQKIKYEIRQIAYSLYRSKYLSKTVYNNLIITI